jgi:hypothetical protein
MIDNIGLTDKDGVTVWLNATQELDKQVEDSKYKDLFKKALNNTNGYPDLTKLLKLKPNPNAK